MGVGAGAAGHTDPEAAQVGLAAVQRQPERTGPVRCPVERYVATPVIRWRSSILFVRHQTVTRHATLPGHDFQPLAMALRQGSIEVIGTSSYAGG